MQPTQLRTSLVVAWLLGAVLALLLAGPVATKAGGPGSDGPASSNDGTNHDPPGLTTIQPTSAATPRSGTTEDVLPAERMTALTQAGTWPEQAASGGDKAKSILNLLV